MARAIWSGSISFGMVSIPVKLYGATESRDIKQVVTSPPTREDKVIDLADALRRSVEAAKKGKPKPPARTRARPARATRRTRKVG